MYRVKQVTIRILTALSFLALAAPLGAAPGATGRPDETADQSSAPAFHLLFIQNAGQFDPAVRFQLRSKGGTWWFTDQAVWLTVTKPDHRPWTTDDGQDDTGDLSSMVRRPWSGVNLRLTFADISRDARLVPSNPQPTQIHYLLGNVASAWHIHVPTFGSLRWQNVYPGVDIDFTTHGFMVHGPGSMVQAHIDGANLLRADTAGRLIADAAIGPITLPAFLTTDGRPLTTAVSGNTVSLSSPSSQSSLSSLSSLPPSDAVFSTLLGGSVNDRFNDIAYGPDGSVYVTGGSYSTDFPTTPGAFDRTCTYFYACLDAFVTHVTADGSGLIYSTYLGGSSWDRAYGLAIGPDHGVYLTGLTFSGDFPTTPGAYDNTLNGSQDGFVAKLSADGSQLLYGTFLGGEVTDSPEGIAVDATGSAYVTGWTNSLNFPTTPGAYDPVTTGGGDGFVSKFNPNGSGLVYSTFIAGSSIDEARSIAVDGQGMAYITGLTWSHDFPTTLGAYDTTFNGGNSDAFITKLNADGSDLVYSTFLGGGGTDTGGMDKGLDIALDHTGAAYVVGHTYSTSFPTTPGAYDTSHSNVFGTDAFIAKLSPSGSQLLYATYLGGSGYDCGEEGELRECGIAVDQNGLAYISGPTNSTDFPTTPGAFDTTANGTDCFLAVLNAEGSGLLYATYLGGSGIDTNEFGNLVVDDSGRVVVGGQTNSRDFPTTPGAFDTSANGGDDVFVTKLQPTFVGSAMHVARIDLSYRPRGNRYRIAAFVTVRDAYQRPVPNAQVSGQVRTPGGRVYSLDGRVLTDNSGLTMATSLYSLAGTYTFTVTNLIRPGWAYNPAQNVETSDSITIP